jgi:hypothetical protein
MKAQSCLRPARIASHFDLSVESPAPGPTARQAHDRLAALALLVLLAPLTQQALSAQQDSAGNPEVTGPQSVQANPDSIVPPSKPSPYKYPPQPDLQSPQADPQPPRPQPHAQQQQAHAKQQQAQVQPQHPKSQQGQAAAQQQQPRDQESQAFAQPRQADPPPPQLHAQLQYAPQPQFSQQQQYAPQPQYAQPQQGNIDPGPDTPPDNPQYDDQQYAQLPQQPAQPFVAEQLEQLVAPIALYPDTLVAQILAASTYPAQVAAADNWLRSLGNASPDQVAYAVDAQTNWDPSVKALAAFPQVLDLMNQDLRWTTDLGNAYYNQPQDVLQTIQVMRQRAQNAGTLQNTPQEEVSNNQGYIQLAPPDPQVVYVPAYNPWTAYGQPVSPYPGFSFSGALGAIGSFLGNGMRFGAGIGMAAFSHTPFGWAGWALNWLASNILFHQTPYYSQSTSVAHWGNPRGGGYGNRYGMGGINRTPNGYGRPEQGYNRLGNGNGQSGFTRPPVRAQENYAYNHPVEAPNRAYGSSYVRPAVRDYTYRPQQQTAQPSRPQAYSGAGGYGFRSNSQQAYAARPAAPYAGQQQVYRAPGSSYQRNDYAQRSYSEPRGYSEPRSYSYSGDRGPGNRGYEQAYANQERSGGSRMFGGGHGEQHNSYKAPKAPREPKMSGGGHHSGGGGHSGGHGGGLFHHSH